MFLRSDKAREPSNLLQVGGTSIRDVKRTPLPYVSNLTDLYALEGKRALLTGEAVLVSLTEVQLEGFEQKVTLTATRRLLTLLRKNPPKLHIAINKAILHSAMKDVQFAFAEESHLKWGMSQKGRYIIVGGVEPKNEKATHIRIFVFDSGTLIDLEERKLPSQEAPHYQDTLAALLEELGEKYPKCRFGIGTPLSDLSAALPQVHYIDGRVYRGLKYRSFFVSTTNRLNAILLPTAIALSGIATSLGLYSKGWVDYHHAIDSYQVAVSDQLVKDVGGVDPMLVEITQQRKAFMEEPKPHSAYAENTKVLVNQIGLIPGIKVVDFRVPAVKGLVKDKAVPQRADVPDGSESTPRPKPKSADVLMTISVPKTTAMALDQGNALMHDVAKATGLSLILTYQGWRDASDGRRSYTLEGTFK